MDDKKINHMHTATCAREVHKNKNNRNTSVKMSMQQIAVKRRSGSGTKRVLPNVTSLKQKVAKIHVQ